MLYFFLSYARGDEDELVQRFYQDLCTEVRLLAGAPSGAAVGFVDRNIQVGERWPGRLSEALAQCGSFLALMTPRYFRSEPCGKEWQLFAQRTKQYEARTSVDSSLLKPLMWVPMPPTKIHPVAEPIQHYSATLGETYARLGVRQLMRLQRCRDDYHAFVFELAGQIVDSVEQHRVPRGYWEADFPSVESAFREPPAAITDRVESGQPASSEPLLVHLIVAAGTRDVMSSVREEVAAYGAHPLEWAVYRPHLPVPLADFAREVASTHGWSYAPVVDVGELASRAELASRHNQIVVLLVDAWATRLDEVKRALRDHNARLARTPPPVTAILIPSGRHDTETRRHWPELSQTCRAIFDRLAPDEELYRSPITTYRAFEMTLPEVLEAARHRMYTTGSVKRPPINGVSTHPPQLDVPRIRELDSEEDLA